MLGDPRKWGQRRTQLLAAGIAVALAVAVLVLVNGGRSPRSRAAPASTAAPVSTASRPSATAGPPAQPPPNSVQLGANVNRLFNDGTYAQRQIDAQLQALRSAGATIARSDAFWEAAEPAPPIGGVRRYDWSFDDRIAGSLAAHGLRWLPIIDYSAPWAQSVPGRDHSPPASAGDYASYAAAFAARYGPEGSFWRAHSDVAAEPVDTFEIWNEPDGAHFWVPVPDANRYADLYLQARDAITTVDPTARVIVGGLTNPARFLPAMIAAKPELRGHIDGVGIHPYSPTPLDLLAAVRSDRRLLTSIGLGSVPLYLTEFGWTTRPAGALGWAPSRLRPKYIAATLAALGHTDCGVGGALLYTWVTPERDSANSEDWFGIHPPRGDSSVDGEAFASGIRAAARPATLIKLCARS